MYHLIFAGVVTYKRVCSLGVANDHHSLGGHVWIYLWGTLRVVTARVLVILSGSFTSHSKSVRWLHHLRGHASHERYTVSNVEGWEINLHMPIPCAPRIEPGAATWQTHTLPLALLQRFDLQAKWKPTQPFSLSVRINQWTVNFKQSLLCTACQQGCSSRVAVVLTLAQAIPSSKEVA